MDALHLFPSRLHTNSKQNLRLKIESHCLNPFFVNNLIDSLADLKKRVAKEKQVDKIMRQQVDHSVATDLVAR